MSTSSTPFSFTIPADEFRNLPVPGISPEAKIGTCFVRVTDLPAELAEFMSVNPRVPKRTTKNLLSGPVPKAILETLRENPADMALKNAGIYLLVDSTEHFREKGGKGLLKVSLCDPERHGIVNGGHTFAAILEARETADPEELQAVSQAFVRLHLMQGIASEMVAEIAEGLNRSKQVQEPSLENLRGHYETIKEVMRDKPGHDDIAYNEGEDKDVYVAEILAYIEMFNLSRYPEDEHPYGLYAHQARAVREASQDFEENPRAMELIIKHLAEILVLGDIIRRDAPIVAKDKVDFQIGRMKLGEGKKGRVASQKNGDTQLHFLGTTTRYRLPNGWLYPMISAFRANVRWDLNKGLFEWRVPNDELLKECLPQMVAVCVNEHRNNNQKPEWVGKRDSAYRQCQLHIELALAKRGKLG
jgi:hypothetical protein